MASDPLFDSTTTDLPGRLSARFRHFAERDCGDDALYAALSRRISETPALYLLLAEAPPTQHLPVLLLAALHDRILDPALARHPLHDYYATAGGDRTPDEALGTVLADFVERHQAVLVRTLQTRSTQTNEVGRCAVLRLALQALALRLPAASGDARPMALFDFGCSAGLNLAVEDYGYDDGLTTVPPPQDGAPLIRSRWRHPPPDEILGPRRWTVVDRHGADLSPIQAADADAARWLRACIWPDDAERGARLAQALAVARRHPPRLVQTDDGLTALTRWLDTLPDGVQPVLTNSWVLAYFDTAARLAFFARVAELVKTRGLAWISGEMGKLSAVDTLPSPPDGEPAATTTLWTLQWRDAGQVRTEPLAWSHPHGKWISWAAPGR